jgi:hypothetical protein
VGLNLVVKSEDYNEAFQILFPEQSKNNSKRKKLELFAKENIKPVAKL